VRAPRKHVGDRAILPLDGRDCLECLVAEEKQHHDAESAEDLEREDQRELEPARCADDAQRFARDSGQASDVDLRVGVGLQS
jgi:hypothetical protein